MSEVEVDIDEEANIIAAKMFEKPKYGFRINGVKYQVLRSKSSLTHLLTGLTPTHRE